MNHEYIHVTSLAMPELSIYASCSEAQLAHYFEPAGGLFIAESVPVVERALDTGYRPYSMLINEEVLEKPRVKALLERVGKSAAEIRSEPFENCQRCDAESIIILKSDGRVRDRMCDAEEMSALQNGAGIVMDPVAEKQPVIYTAPRPVLDELTGFYLTGGVLCAMHRKAPLSAQELYAGASRLAVLENVTNPTNVGAIFRSAAALGMDGVLLGPGCADPLYRRCIRVSMGTVFQIPWAHGQTDDVAGELHRAGFRTVAMALEEESVSLRELVIEPKEKAAVLLGNEGYGLKPETIRGCDTVVMIPMQNQVDSLNVAAASAVAFWAVGR